MSRLNILQDVIDVIGYTTSAISGDYNKRGLINAVRGDNHNAINDFNKAINNGYDNKVTYWNRGIAHCKLGDISQGLDDLNYFRIKGLVCNNIGNVEKAVGLAPVSQNPIVDGITKAGFMGILNWSCKINICEHLNENPSVNMYAAAKCHDGHETQLSLIGGSLCTIPQDNYYNVLDWA